MHYLQRKYDQLTHFFRSYYFECIHALKAAIAMMIGYVFYLFIPNHHDLMPQWILVTIIVVMSSHSALGAQISKSIFRIWATLAGALLAIIALLTPHHEITFPVYLFFSSAIFIFIAVSYDKYSYMGSLGIITFALIILAAEPSIKLAAVRATETLLGILISLLVSRFLFPIRSIRLIKQRCFTNLARITELYQLVLVDNKNRFQESSIVRLESKIIGNHNMQRQLQAQIKYENKKDRLKVENIELIIRSQTALYRYFTVLEISKRILLESLDQTDIAFIQLKEFIEELILFLKDFVKNYPTIPTDFLTPMQEKNNALEIYTHGIPHHSAILSPLHTLCFITNRIIRVCKELTERIHIIQ